MCACRVAERQTDRQTCSAHAPEYNFHRPRSVFQYICRSSLSLSPSPLPTCLLPFVSSHSLVNCVLKATPTCYLVFYTYARTFVYVHARMHMNAHKNVKEGARETTLQPVTTVKTATTLRGLPQGVYTEFNFSYRYA